MSSQRPVDAVYGFSKDGLLRQLVELGSPLTTFVTVNGRTLLLESAITLIEQLPEDWHFGRRATRIFIHPDPFTIGAYPSDRVNRGFDSSDLVKTLLERQDEADRLAEDERGGGRWWRKLLRLVKIGS